MCWDKPRPSFLMMDEALSRVHHTGMMDAALFELRPSHRNDGRGLRNTKNMFYGTRIDEIKQ